MKEKLFKVTWIDPDAAYEEDPAKFLGITYASTERDALEKVYKKINNGEARGCLQQYCHEAKNLVLSAEIKQEEGFFRDRDGRKVSKTYNYVEVHISFDIEGAYDVTENGHHEEEFTTIFVEEIELLENQQEIYIG